MSLDSSINNIKRKLGEFFFSSIGMRQNFMLGNTNPITIDTSNVYKVYAENPHLRVVINEKSKMFSNVRLLVEDIDTGKIVPHDQVTRLLNKPNPLQAQNTFMHQYNFYKDLWANAFIYELSGGLGDIPAVLWNLPPSQMEVVPTGKLFQQTEIEDIIKEYKLTGTGKELTFKVDEIIHKCVNDSNDYLTGLSKIETLQLPLSNIQGALKTRNIIIHEKGAIGMLANDNKDNSGGIPLGTTEREKIEKEYRNKYGIGDSQSKILITNASLKWMPMSYPTKDLMLFEEIEDDFATILSAYGMDRDLFPSTKGATFENKRAAEKRTYQSTIQPEADDLAQSLTESFNLMDDGLRIIASLKHLPVMREDELKEAQEEKVRVDTYSVMLSDGILNKEQYAGLAGIEFTASEDTQSQDDKIANAQVDLRGTVGGVNGIVNINAAVSRGEVDRTTAINILVTVYGFDLATATGMITAVTAPTGE